MNTKIFTVLKNAVLCDIKILLNKNKTKKSPERNEIQKAPVVKNLGWPGHKRMKDIVPLLPEAWCFEKQNKKVTLSDSWLGIGSTSKQKSFSLPIQLRTRKGLENIKPIYLYSLPLSSNLSLVNNLWRSHIWNTDDNLQ